MSITYEQADRIRAFRQKRIEEIQSSKPIAIQPDKTKVKLQEGPKAVLHLVPSSVGKPVQKLLNISTIIGTKLNKLTSTSITSGRGTRQAHPNFEGFMSYSLNSKTKAVSQYFQLFRNGSIEDTHVFSQSSSIDINGYKKALRDNLPKLLDIQKESKVEPPILLMLSLLDAEGYQSNENNSVYAHPIERKNLLVPEIVIENFEVDPADELYFLVFDALSNACGSYPSY